MSDRQAKDALFDAFAEWPKALGNGRRAELVDVLAQGERHVEELAAEIGQSVANTSSISAPWPPPVSSPHDETGPGSTTASPPNVGDLWGALRDVTATHHEQLGALAAAYLGDRSRLEQIDRHELAQRIAAGDVVIVDVRPAAEYAAGHIAGARSIPIDRLAADMKELPDGIEVVAYCRGPYCVYADDAVRLLRRRGRSARRLEDGYPEWQRADLPVETAAP